MTHMSRKLRPLAALAVVALISAGCGSNAPSETGTASSSGTASTASSTGANKKATDQDKAVKFAECIRAHGVPHFPDPDAKGEFVFGVECEPRGVAEGRQRVQGPAATGRVELESGARSSSRQPSGSPSAFATTA